MVRFSIRGDKVLILAHDMSVALRSFTGRCYSNGSDAGGIHERESKTGEVFSFDLPSIKEVRACTSAKDSLMLEMDIECLPNRLCKTQVRIVVRAEYGQRLTRVMARQA